jgi:hypothetical protein
MKRLFLFIIVIAVFAACNSQGEKYQVNEKSEIYYKDGMTAGDAKLLGDFLLKNGYFDTLNEKTVQLGVEKDTITVKFAVDKGKVLQDEVSADAMFMIMGTAISADVFAARPLKIVLADLYMKGFRNVFIPGTNTSGPNKK